MGGVNLLLDTHVLLWLLGDAGRVPDDALIVLGDTSNTLLVSAVSAMEVATKVRLGRLPQGRHLVDGWTERVSEIGAEELQLTSRHGILAGSLGWDHRDPFDRLLVAQALVDNLVLVTADRTVARHPGLRLLTW